MNEGYIALKLDVTGALPADVAGDQPKAPLDIRKSES